MFDNLMRTIRRKLHKERYLVADGVNFSSLVFQSCIDGHKAYRIPALLALPDDTILAFCEARVNSGSDYGNINLALKRSKDGGKTWSEMEILWNAGELAVQNPMPIFDTVTKEIILGICLDRKDQYIMKSADFGETWTEPILVTGVRKENWKFGGCSPGHGIQLKSGRLLFTGMYRISEEITSNKRTWGSHYLYSDDHGTTWKLGHVFEPPTTDESLSVELADGRVCSILRITKRKEIDNLIALAYSEDGGETATSPKPHSQLLTPTCQSSICRYSLVDSDGNGKNRILFSNPDSLRRVNMTVKLSYDESESWPIKKTLFKGKAAYSDLAVLSDNSICCFFEAGLGGGHMDLLFVRFTLEWLTDNQDSN